MNKLTVCKDNRVIEAGYKLSKLEQCLILFAVAKNNPLKFQRKISFYVKEFIEMFPTFSEKNIYSQLKKAVDELYERSIVVNNPVSIKKFRWVSSAEYYTGEARIDVNFTEEIEPYLSDLNARFTQYKLFNVSKFKSDYSFRLYELFIQYLKIGTRDILIDDLRTMLIIGEKYKTNKSFNQLLIKPCVAEINKLSDLKISYVAIKKGVSIVGYKFTRKISFYVKEFIEMFPTFSEKNIYSQLKKAVDELYERSIVVNNPVSIKKFRWVSSAEYYTGEARIDVNFTEEIEPYLSDLNARFTQYKLFNVSKFKSDYSFRLYELFIQYLKIGTRDILIDDLRTMLIIGKKYKSHLLASPTLILLYQTKK